MWCNPVITFPDNRSKLWALTLHGVDFDFASLWLLFLSYTWKTNLRFWGSSGKVSVPQCWRLYHQQITCPCSSQSIPFLANTLSVAQTSLYRKGEQQLKKKKNPAAFFQQFCWPVSTFYNHDLEQMLKTLGNRHMNHELRQPGKKKTSHRRPCDNQKNFKWVNIDVCKAYSRSAPYPYPILLCICEMIVPLHIVPSPLHRLMIRWPCVIWSVFCNHAICPSTNYIWSLNFTL